MAQGALASVPLAFNGIGSSTTTALTAEELREILEYDRIVQFRDAVFAGTHPRVKIPAHLVGKPVPPPLPFLSGNNFPHPQSESSMQYAPIDHNNGIPSKTSQKTKSTNSGNSSNLKTEINPIFLQKSDDLIKAEIQLQRQRLERGLREQIEQQRVAAKAAMQTSEALPGFDLSEVLSKALAIVQSSAPVDANGSDGRSSASDSFDERTFYSSQHDTPMSSSSRGRRDRNASQAFASPQGPYLKPRLGKSDRAQAGGYGADTGMSDAPVVAKYVKADQLVSGAQDSHSIGSLSSTMPQPQLFGLPAASNIISSHGRDDQDAFSQNPIVPSFIHSQPLSSASIVQGRSQELLGGITNDHRPSPLIRAHNLSPFAPQPARVSPLITTRDVPTMLEYQQEGAQPAQVAALRHNASGLSSTDSSPRADKSDHKKKKEKRKGKGKEREKKRKAKDNVAASPDSPYIKPEPQSPEPFAPASLPRPQKRPRQSGQFSAGLTYDEPEILESRPQLPNPQSANRNYSRHGARYEEEQTPSGRVYRGEQMSYRDRGIHHIDRIQSPLYPPLPSSTHRSIRAVSRAVIERPVAAEPRYYAGAVSRASIRPEGQRNRSRSPIMIGDVEAMRPPVRRTVMRVVCDEFGNEQYVPTVQSSYPREAISRASIRPDVVRHNSGSPIPRGNSPLLMAPPKRAMRVVVDEFGREYLEPVQEPIVTRRYRESEMPYERAVSRAVSTRIPADGFESDGVIYRHAPAAHARRVVTQPEYLQEDGHRDYRQREYSMRPAGEGESFVEIRAPARRVVSHYDEPAREVIRQSTVRPEAVRYELPREYSQRVQSVRPEGPATRVYVDDGRPAVRREMPPQGVREFSVRADAPPREYAASVRPEGRREVNSHGQREYSVRPSQQRPVYADMQGDQHYEEMPSRRPAEMVYVERPGAREGSVMVYADDVRREVYR